MCNFKSALLIPRFPSSDGFDIFHSEGVNSHTALMELANINPNDKNVKVAKLELLPDGAADRGNVDTWDFVLDETRRPDWLDDSMLSDAEYELRQICSRYISKDGKCSVVNISGNKRWYFNGKLHREDGPAIEHANGDKEWYFNGECHREDGPAAEYVNGDKYWYFLGSQHREDGPAVEWHDGSKKWYIHGRLHREDGPAIKHANGHRRWYLNGKLHREDGPAIEWENGTKFWWINGHSLTKEEFNARQFSLLTQQESNDYGN